MDDSGLPRAPSARFVGAAALLLAALPFASADTRTMAPNKTGHRMAIEGLTEPLSNLKLFDFEGKDITAELRPQSEGGHVSVALTRLNQFVVKPNTISTLKAPAQGKITLPGGIVVPLVAAPDASTAPNGAWFRLTFAASPTPAPWDEKIDDYVTRLTFGLRRPPQIPETIGLERPVVVKLEYEGLTAAEVPPFTIEAPGLEHEKTIELHFQPSTPNPKLLVRSTLSDVNLELEALARLVVRPQRHELLGFGLESAPVVVESIEADGEPRPVARQTAVAIEIEGDAECENGNVVFAAGAANATFHLRSAGVGLVTVSVAADGLRGRAVIQQVYPIGPLVAALFGAGLGGYARRFVKGARRSRALRRVIEGVIAGLVAFVAGVLGVGYLHLPPPIVATEAGAFLVSALAGFAGVSVLETLGAKKPVAV